jgi:hypothetical protein
MQLTKYLSPLTGLALLACLIQSCSKSSTHGAIHTTAPIIAPGALLPIRITDTSFIARWQTDKAATGYQLYLA